MTPPAAGVDIPQAEVGVIGGSGFYTFLSDAEEVTVDTPYGPPSGPVSVGRVGERRVAFIARHGPRHEHPPHTVPYRANIWALHHLGVTNVFGPCASGSLQPEVAPGSFVVPDQLVDRTWGRPDTFFDGPQAHHLPFADPYDADLRSVAVASCRAEGVDVHDGGTVVVVQGPRFSTRAESKWFSSFGWEVVNMTQHPEAALCREAGLRYAAIALITDYDAGLEDSDTPAVTQEEVFAFFQANLETVRAVLGRALAADLPTGRVAAGPGF